MGTGETAVYREQREDSLARVAFDRLWLAKSSGMYVPESSVVVEQQTVCKSCLLLAVVIIHGSNANEAQTNVNHRTRDRGNTNLLFRRL